MSTVLDGKLENEIELPGLGTVGGFGGRIDDKFTFYTFTSLTFPATIYKYDIATKKSTLFRQPEIPGFKSTDYETKQVFYNEQRRHACADVSGPQEGPEA